MHTQLYKDIIALRVHFMPEMNLEDSREFQIRYTPDEVRQTVSALVSEERLELADSLAQAGLALFPESDDILAIAGLVAMLREDWEEAGSLLNELLVLQGNNAPITTHLMFIRSLRCAGEQAAALSAVMLAHEQYPNHPELEAEFEAISAQMGLKSA